MKKQLLQLFAIILPSLSLVAQGFPPTSVNWQVPLGGYTGTSLFNNGFYLNSLSSANAGANGCQNWFMMDINGDGNQDLVVPSTLVGTNVQVFSPSSNPYWKVYFGNGSGFSSTATNWPIPTGGYTGTSLFNHGFYLSASSSANGGANGCENWFLTDMNNDKKPDLVVPSSLVGSNVQVYSPSSNPYWKVYLNSGSGFATSATNWSVPVGGYTGTSLFNNGFYLQASSSANGGANGCQNWYITDINGDGNIDLVIPSTLVGTNVQVYSPSSNPFWKVYFGNGTGFSNTATNWPIPTGGYTGTSLFNNGFYLSASSSANGGANGCENWFVSDMNNDQKPDLVIPSSLVGSNVQVYNPSSNPYWKVYLNSGSGFATSSINWSVPVGGYTGTSLFNNGFYLQSLFSANGGANGCQNWYITDINGDGNIDLVIPSTLVGTNVQVFSPSSNPYWRVYYGTASGFSSSASNWSIPTGGYTGTSLFNNGFYLSASSSANGGANGCENWFVSDLNGDKKPDLVLPSSLVGSNVQVYSPSANPYWKVYMNTSTVDLAEIESLESQLHVFPNPSNGTFTIKSNRNETITIVNEIGQIISKHNLDEMNNYNLTISNLSNGVYFAKSSQRTIKLIILN